MKIPFTSLGRTLPVALLVLLVGIAGLLYGLRGKPDEPRDPESPAPPSPGALEWLSPADRETLGRCRSRLRDRLGEDAEAIDDLRRLLPAEPARAVELLRLLRPELDLAVRSGDPAAGRAALALLLAALREGGAEVRVLIESSAFRQLHRRSLESEAPELRRAGLDFLGVIGGPAVPGLAARLLADEDPRVRGAAVRTYGAHAGPRSVERLTELFAVEMDVGVRTRILEVFGSRRELRTVEARAIERRAIEGGVGGERFQALDNLALFRDHDALEAVLGLLCDE
ncbi:MAG: HEAT repeat domain-containing protein, partial [Planctomycetota bacterium]